MSSTKNFIVTTIFLLIVGYMYSCSMYKITIGGKTMVGCNEDAWRTTPHIWFENAPNPGLYGAAFTGSRYDPPFGYAPQSGMNEYGLSFSRLASHTPETNSNCISKGITITHPTVYLKDIIHSCKTVEEVQEYISRYNHSYFIEDVFIYIDKSGKYLVVEPYTMNIGNNSNYVLSNFCPSVTDQNDALKLQRYRNGIEFLNHKTDTTIAFCTALSDTMHVCREKIGDGTLLTSIWDLNSGNVNLYFYHKYDKTVQFNLKDELAKGDHSIKVQTLFPENLEFQKLGSYQTPQNNNFIRFSLLIVGIIFLFSSIYFLVGYFKYPNNRHFRLLKLVWFSLGILMFYYMFVLVTNVNIFYFSSPYVDPRNIFISITSYIPFLILILIIPLILIIRKIFKANEWGSFSKILLCFNIAIYLTLIGLFSYWGFYGL